MNQQPPQTIKNTRILYISGFILSILLTLLAFAMVNDKILKGTGLLIALLAAAIVQLFVQLVFFLHLDRESKPRWNLMTFLFAALVVLIVVIGSLWIMANLNYNMNHNPSEVDKYIREQEDL